MRAGGGRTEDVPTPTAAAWSNPSGADLDLQGARWFVVHTQPHNEARASTNLAQQDFYTFFPSIPRTVRHARQTKTVLAPLFPNYIFVRFDPLQDQWRSINGTRGVIRIITHGDLPIALPQGVIEDLQSRTQLNSSVMDWTKSMRIGDEVKITEGPFANLVGTLEHLDASGRVQVLLDLLGRAVRVSLGGQAVMPSTS